MGGGFSPIWMEAFFRASEIAKPAEKLKKIGIYVIKTSKSSCACVYFRS